MRARLSSAAPLLLSIAGLGAAALVTQLALLRELMAAFGGNELLLGSGFGFWLLATAAGTWLAGALTRTRRAVRARYPGDISHASRPEPEAAGACASFHDHPGMFWGLGWAVLASLPLLQLHAVQVWRDVVFTRGTVVPPAQAALFVSIVLAPYCLVSGAWLARAAAFLCDEGAASAAARLYAADVAGALLGGVAFSFLFAPSLDTWTILLLSGALLLALVCIAEFASDRPRWGFAHAGLAAALAGAALLGGWEQRALAKTYGADVEARTHPSPYRRIVEVRAHGQTTVFLDGQPAITSGDTLLAEELAHGVLGQRSHLGPVLVLGAGPTSLLSEIARHGPSDIVLLEPDAALRALAETRFRADVSARGPCMPVHFSGEEVRRRLAKERGRYAAIIVAEPPPSNVQLNRHYSSEFFEQAARALAPGGVLLVSVGEYANAVSPELAALLSSLRHTLARHFAHQLFLPGSRIHALASDAPLTPDIHPALASRGIVPAWLTDAYLRTQFAEDRLAQLDHASRSPAPINRDLQPTLPPLLLRHWLSRFEVSASWLGPALALATAIVFLALHPAPRIAFAAGFAGGSLELALLFAFQALFGSLHLHVGLLVTSFMAGMALGARHPPGRVTQAGPRSCAPSSTTFQSRASAATDDRAIARTNAFLLLAVFAGAAALLGVALPAFGSIQHRLPSVWLAEAPLFAAACLVGWGTGAVFPLASRLMDGRTQSPAPAAATGASGKSIRETGRRGTGASVLVSLYAADCLGAAAGSLVAGLWLLPQQGLSWTCVAAAAMLVAALVGLMLRTRLAA